MYSIALMLRVAKQISVTAIALMCLLIVTDNITDYYTNYYFVEHVMKMDTIFPGSNLQYRSIGSPFIFHAGYILIILVEIIMTICSIKGSWLMLKNIRKDAATFHASK